MPSRESIVGCLLGTAVGDSVGLPCEGLSKRRQHRMYPKIVGPRLVFGRGMVSDDTEHACMVAQALVVTAGDLEALRRNLAWRFRLWLLGAPASIGFATLRAILRLWLGYSGHRSGVFSAGNGPAARSSILGVCYGGNPQHLRELVSASTRMTHLDPKAYHGALAVAVAAHLAARRPHIDVTGELYARALVTLLPPDADEFVRLVGRAVKSVGAGHPTQAFAEELGLGNGVTGYIYHTVPVALHAWLTHQRDYRTAIIDAVRCGGDTDTTAAIVGAIVGASVGKAGIPGEWLARLWEWPRTVQWMEALGERLAEVILVGAPREAIRLPLPAVIARNLLFLAVVLVHGVRRAFPPY